MAFNTTFKTTVDSTTGRADTIHQWMDQFPALWGDIHFDSTSEIEVIGDTLITGTWEDEPPCTYYPDMLTSHLQSDSAYLTFEYTRVVDTQGAAQWHMQLKRAGVYCGTEREPFSAATDLSIPDAYRVPVVVHLA